MPQRLSGIDLTDTACTRVARAIWLARAFRTRARVMNVPSKATVACARVAAVGSRADGAHPRSPVGAQVIYLPQREVPGA
eukprot:509395-Prymnesium_polylepis.1